MRNIISKTNKCDHLLESPSCGRMPATMPPEFPSAARRVARNRLPATGCLATRKITLKRSLNSDLIFSTFTGLYEKVVFDSFCFCQWRRDGAGQLYERSGRLPRRL